MEFVLNSPVTFAKATIIMNVFLISISWGDVVGGKIVIKRHSSLKYLSAVSILYMLKSCSFSVNVI